MLHSGAHEHRGSCCTGAHEVCVKSSPSEILQFFLYCFLYFYIQQQTSTVASANSWFGYLAWIVSQSLATYCLYLQVGLIWPILFVAVSVFIVCVPLITNPVEAGNLLFAFCLHYRPRDCCQFGAATVHLSEGSFVRNV